MDNFQWLHPVNTLLHTVMFATSSVHYTVHTTAEQQTPHTSTRSALSTCYQEPFLEDALQQLVYVKVQQLVYVKVQQLVYVKVQQLVYVKVQQLVYVKVQQLVYVKEEDLSSAMKDCEHHYLIWDS